MELPFDCAQKLMSMQSQNLKTFDAPQKRSPSGTYTIYTTSLQSLHCVLPFMPEGIRENIKLNHFKPLMFILIIPRVLWLSWKGRDFFQASLLFVMSLQTCHYVHSLMVNGVWGRLSKHFLSPTCGHLSGQWPCWSAGRRSGGLTGGQWMMNGNEGRHTCRIQVTLNPFMPRALLDTENKIKKSNFTKYLKESCILCSEEQFPFKYFEKNGLIIKLSTIQSGIPF